MKGDELLKFKSVQNWLDSIDSSAKRRGKKGLTKNAKAMRLGRMWEYTNKGLLNPDEILAEAKKDIKLTGKRLDDYFYAKKKETSQNSAVTSVSYIRSFFTHNNVTFPKSIPLPKNEEAKVATRDEKTNFYDFDEKTEEFIFKNGTLQHFIQNLNFRDQTIALCLLSTGADATDLLKLKVGFVKDQKGELSKKKRFFWHGNRSKTHQPFRTFFSEEATHFLKRYLEQERKDASDDEPLFVGQKREYTISKGERKGEKVVVDEKFTAHSLSMNFRKAAEKMGYAVDHEANPFRPKRFRHLFRTACAIAEIDEGYTKAMMGHASDISAVYLEKNSAIFKKVYVKAEPFLTVFGVNKGQVTELSREITGLKDELTLVVEGNKGIGESTTQLKAEIKQLKEDMEDLRIYTKFLKWEIENRDRAEAKEDFMETVREVNKMYPTPKLTKEEIERVKRMMTALPDME